MLEDRTFKIGINQTIVDKPSDFANLNPAKNWQNLELSEEDLIRRIQSGYAFSAHFKEGHRRTTNFICSDFIAADVDGSMSIEQAIDIRFVDECASFLYTTPSHTPERHRFRIVFLLQETIRSSEQWRNALLGLALKLGSDLSIKDAGRMFFGNTNGVVRTIGQLLPAKEVVALAAAGSDHRGRSSISDGLAVPVTSSQRIEGDRWIKTASGSMSLFRALSPGSSVCCPFHIDTRPSAFVVRSLNGTSTGVHCSVCNTTFWEEDPQGYDFDAFDRLVAERAEIDQDRIKESEASGSFLEQYFPPAPSLTFLEQTYMPRLDYRPGITMVKSPKGTGKTEALKALIAQIRGSEFPTILKSAERPKSVLLVGHRRSLIREAAKKLGLACYLDKHEYEDRRDGFAICLDSLHSVATSKAGKLFTYDVLILDESEQVFSHLTGDTIAQKPGGVSKAYFALRTVIQQAKAVYALDADLGLITAHTLRELRATDWENACRLIVNKPSDANAQKRPIFLYQAKTDLEAKLISAVKEGKRCFVVSNSRKAIDTLEQIIVNRCGQAIKTRKITSENSQLADERDFVLNIKTEFLKIQVLLCSPSLGTGVDITFPGGERQVDHVFGFFYSNVNTHTDIDQQIARVRNPGEVSVWFDKRRSRFETSFDTIRTDLARGHLVPGAVREMGHDGELTYDENHPLLLIWTHVICAQRSSKNRLVELFTRLRETNGWDVRTITKGEMPQESSTWKEAEQTVMDERIKRIMAADDVTDDEVIELHEAKRRQGLPNGQTLTPTQLDELERGRLRMTYGVQVTPALIELDAAGRLQDRIRNFQTCFDKRIGPAIEDFLADLEKDSKSLKATNLSITINVLLRTAGLVQDGIPDVSAGLTKASLAFFTRVCRSNKTVLEEITGFEIRSDLEKNPVRTLNEILALVGLKLDAKKRIRIDGQPTHIYGLDTDGLERMMELSENFRDFESVVKNASSRTAGEAVS